MPVTHQFHHSAELRHRDTNIGSCGGLMVCDWMFGTLCLPERGEVCQKGLNADEPGSRNPHPSLREFCLEPFRHAWALLRREGFGSFRPAPRLAGI